MNLEHIKVSIIISVLNAEKTIENCLNSIINQEHKNIEIIVVDGKSKDNTVRIIEQFTNNIHFFISEPDNGIYDAWNKALKQVTGQWVCFIGSDDILLNGGIKEMLQLANRPEVNFISAKVMLVDEFGNDVVEIGKAWNSNALKKGLGIVHCGALHSNSLFFNEIFDSNFKIAGDFDFLSRISKHIKATFLNEVTVKMFYGGLSRNKINKVIFETCIILWKNNSFSKFYAFKYFINAHLRNIIRNIFFKIPLLNRLYNNFKKINCRDLYVKHNE